MSTREFSFWLASKCDSMPPGWCGWLPADLARQFCFLPMLNVPHPKKKFFFRVNLNEAWELYPSASLKVKWKAVYSAVV